MNEVMMELGLAKEVCVYSKVCVLKMLIMEGGIREQRSLASRVNIGNHGWNHGTR
jgi:hypothetical protein